MKKTVILGAGFGGIACARQLIGRTGLAVTVVDREDYQLFYPDLYEVATSEEELTTVADLKTSVGAPLEYILRGSDVSVVRDTVTDIDLGSRVVTCGQRRIEYDYLVCALGSKSCFFGIPGAAQYALPLKSLPDALRIRQRLEFMVQRHQYDTAKPFVQVVVAGGGLSGLEFSAELSGFFDILALKYGVPRDKLLTLILEGAPHLLPNLPNKVSSDAKARLMDLGVRLSMGSRIVNVDEHFVSLSNGEKIIYDCLIWTAGVEAVTPPFSERQAVDRCQRVKTSEHLQLPEHPEVFCIGDSAACSGLADSTDPQTAQYAMRQGRYVASAISSLIQNKRPPKYQSKPTGYVMPLGGKFAICYTSYFYTIGFFGYIAKQLADLNYLVGILGFWRGFTLMLKKLDLYRRND